MKQPKKLSFIEKIVLSIIEDQPKGTMNTQRVYARIPKDSSIQKDAVYQALLSLTHKQLIDQPSKGNFAKKLPEMLFKARVIVNFAGELLLKDDEKNEIIRIPQVAFRGLLPEDIVEIGFQRKGKRQEISRLKLIKREPRKVIGYLDVFNDNGYLLTGKSGYNDIQIDEPVNSKYDGLKAVVEVYDYPENSKYPLGKLIQVLGKAGEHETEMHAIVAEFGFSSEFPADVLLESEAISETIPQEEIKNRKDFRKITTFTIDPVDAKDFDDAISLEKLENNRYKIGIHIADVSHYVKPGTALEREAINRATSVYLVDRTIPMLPEKLSNNLCSLRPHEDRLCFSVELELDENWNVCGTWIGKGIIHSDRRFSYEEAQERIVNKSGDYFEELDLLNRIALKYEKIRFKNGALRFESKELKFQLDENNLPTKVIEKERFEAHKLIETYMLLANQAVATYVFNLKKPNPPFIYRTHDEPPKDKLLEFAKFCKLIGYPIQIDNEKQLRQSLNGLLERTAGKPEEELLQQMSIRTMAKAVYTSQKTSHFGLAFDFYTHFTSPIRRYPDLLAHRILFEYLNQRESPYSESQIEELAKHSSNMEQKASEAERASIKYKLAELMKFHEGEVFEARITGVTDWGIYATILDYHAEGLIRLTDIRFDHFYFVESERKVVGKRSKRTYQLGDIISVRVKKANVASRTIDLALMN